MSWEQLRAVQELRRDDSIVILPADKGNVTVVMNRNDYNSKMEALLQSTDYEIVKKDPTAKLEKMLNDMLREQWTSGEISKVVYDKLRASYSAIPQLYGLPKSIMQIHP